MKPSTPLLSLSLAVFGYAAFAGGKTWSSNEVSFGRDVRPILSEHCFKCHGPDVGTAAAGLRLDSFPHATAKLRNGAAIVPGNPGASHLLNRVSDGDPEMRMPPADAGVSRLTPAQIATLRAWIAGGAHYEKHWSFVPPSLPKIPAVSDPKWARNLVDRFVLHGLDEVSLKPEPEADRDTLALRAAQTLTGLPPTPAELRRFRGDLAPGAYERFVDRLLAKPEYGEHEARYWLDAVRYGDTHGLQLDNERSVYPYRDWVVQAFNDDLPFDRFVRWQLAGDLLPHPTTEQLVATGYVRMNLTSNEGGAIPDEFLARNTFDRVDTTSTVLLGLTVGCAKCHDHKYDPIKQKDYYGLYAYFNSTQDDPLDGNVALPPPFVRAASREQEKRLKEIETNRSRLLTLVDPSHAALWFRENRQPVPVTHDWQITPSYVSPTFDRAFDDARPGEPGTASAVWKPFAFESGKEFAGIVGKDDSSVYLRGVVAIPAARAMTMLVSSDDGVKLWLNGKLIHSHKITRGVATGFDVVKAEFNAGDNELIVKVVNGGAPDGLKIRFARPDDERIEGARAAFEAAPDDPAAQAALQSLFLTLGPATGNAIAFRKLDAARTTLENEIPMSLIARELAKPRPTFVLKRGEYSQKGEPVERHIPSALGKLPRGVSNDRLGLATWLTEPSNPLVARVFVNRLWQQHFGTGIVKTVEDFGNQGEWPVDQPLLDYLAVSFVKNGWSVKRLNRLIVTSAAFRQSSRISPAKLSRDPENRLISRGPRFRLDAEVIRDKALEAGGLLIQKIGGHGIKPYQPDGLWEGSSDPASGTHVYVRDHGKDVYRRSLYLFWKRTSPPSVMTTLDAPLRDTCIVRRGSTDTPLQALAILNEPAFLESSRTMAARLLSAPGDDERRLRRLFDVTLGRAPRPFEVVRLRRSLDRYRRTYGADVPAARRILRVGDFPQSETIAAPEQARLDDRLLHPYEHRRVRHPTLAMDPIAEAELMMTRRQLFGKATLGVGTAALSRLLGVGGLSSLAGLASSAVAQARNGLPGMPNFAPRAKHVIYLFMSGGPSQLDLWDYKPKLNDLFDTDLPDRVRHGQRVTTMTSGQARFPIAPSKFKFAAHNNGSENVWVSELLPYTAGVVNELCVVRSMWTESINHDPATTFMQTGSPLPGRPSMGAWMSYGLGSMNENLPTYVVLHSKVSSGKPNQPVYPRLWGTGFLPSQYQGVSLRSSGDPVLYLKDPDGMNRKTRRAMLDDVAALNHGALDAFGDPEINARIEQYELAYRLQSSVPDLMDLSKETAETFELYGQEAREPGTFAANCLLARRMVQRGVRFIQIFHRGWDLHSDVGVDLPSQTKDVDRACAALVRDLKRTGLLDETLVIWGGEFGRTVYSQGPLSHENYGRDHHPRAFTVWMAGGGVKAGVVYGATDDYGYNIVDEEGNPIEPSVDRLTPGAVHVHDLQATILNRLGVDHTKLTYRYQGRDFRLTDVHGHVIQDLLV